MEKYSPQNCQILPLKCEISPQLRDISSHHSNFPPHIYFKTLKSEQAQMSYVTTPELIVSDTEDNCLEFYYHLDGIDTGAFVIIANALDTPFSEIAQEGNIPAQRGGQVIVIYQTRTVTSEWKRTLITFSPKRLGQKNGDRVNFSLIYRDVRGPKGDFGKFSLNDTESRIIPDE